MTKVRSAAEVRKSEQVGDAFYADLEKMAKELNGDIIHTVLVAKDGRVFSYSRILESLEDAAEHKKIWQFYFDDAAYSLRTEVIGEESKND